MNRFGVHDVHATATQLRGFLTGSSTNCTTTQYTLFYSITPLPVLPPPPSHNGFSNSCYLFLFFPIALKHFNFRHILVNRSTRVVIKAADAFRCVQGNYKNIQFLPIILFPYSSCKVADSMLQLCKQNTSLGLIKEWWITEKRMQNYLLHNYATVICFTQERSQTI